MWTQRKDDIANVSQELPIVDYFQKIKQEGLISETAYEKITWRNAARLLGLDLEVDAQAKSGNAQSSAPDDPDKPRR